MRYRYFSFLLCGCLFLESCQRANTPEHANTLITDGWVGPTPYPSVADERPIYCYRTLGNQDCYSRPKEGWEERLIESYEPPSPPVFTRISMSPIRSAPVSSSISGKHTHPSLEPMKLNP